MSGPGKTRTLLGYVIVGAVAAVTLARIARLMRGSVGAAGSIYSTPEGEAIFLRLYDRAVERLGVNVERKWVDTRFGSTHVLVAGPPEAPPVVVTHGGNSINPLSLEWFRPLMRDYRIYAPDTIGHPGYSAQRRLSPSGDDYGRWLVDVLDGLDLQRVAMVGGSYGAGIIVRAAAYAPHRISMAALVVPSGIVAPPVIPLVTRLALPMAMYRLFPSEKTLLAAATPLFSKSEPIDPVWLEAIETAFKHLKVEAQMPRAASLEELRGFQAPTLVIAAEEDVLFPGRRVVERASKLFPNLQEAVLLPGASHSLPATAVEDVRQRIRTFLEMHHQVDS